MTLLEDTRQKSGKHKAKRAFFEKAGVKVLRSKLPAGDYGRLDDLSVVVDTKKDILELVQNVTSGHKRFVRECDLAKENGILLYVLTEDAQVKTIEDLNLWQNPRRYQSPGATKGATLAKILHGMELRHGVKFLFCPPEEAGLRILELLGGGKDGQRVD